MGTRTAPSSIDEYLRSLAPEVRQVMQSIRAAVGSALPAAHETIGYQMPAFKLERIFFYFAAFKHHVGVYPPVRGSASLDKALLPYQGEKGNLRFPLAQPMPLALITRVAKALARQRAGATVSAGRARVGTSRKSARKV